MKRLFLISLVLVPVLVVSQKNLDPQPNSTNPKKHSIIPEALFLDPDSTLIPKFLRFELPQANSDPVFKMPVIGPQTKHATPIFPADTANVIPIRILTPIKE